MQYRVCKINLSQTSGMQNGMFIILRKYSCPLTLALSSLDPISFSMHFTAMRESTATKHIKGELPSLRSMLTASKIDFIWTIVFCLQVVLRTIPNTLVVVKKYKQTKKNCKYYETKIEFKKVNFMSYILYMSVIDIKQTLSRGTLSRSSMLITTLYSLRLTYSINFISLVIVRTC